LALQPGYFPTYQPHTPHLSAFRALGGIPSMTLGPELGSMPKGLEEDPSKVWMRPCVSHLGQLHLDCIMNYTQRMCFPPQRK
jgi:hypothetical protein